MSAGGNLLLDIGPAADGTIPVIMQQRLLEMGKWLKTNGEAIYGTRAYIRTRKDMQINPETNKTVFFTQKDNNLFITCLKWPANGIVLEGIAPSGALKATMLGSDKQVSVTRSGKNIIITPPALTPDDNESAYVFKIVGIIK